MQNSEKIDINLEADSLPDGELTEEQRCQEHYERALRYINIARYMKQYEDQDKYYHRALVNLRKAKAAIPGLRPLMLDVVYRKYYARANGKISLYQEACSIMDNARTPTDYLTAQTLFDRIHAYETKHQIQEKYVSPELFAKVGKCADSAEQSVRCGELANQLMAKQRRKSLISSGILILAIIALLAFSRTTTARYVLGEAYCLAHHYEGAYQHFLYVYNKTGDEAAFEKYKESRYLFAVDASETRNLEDVRDSFRELARVGYKDSEEYLIKLEKARIAELADGEKIRFGEVNWRILTHEGNKVLMLKDKTQGGVCFHNGGGATDWEHSSIRQWLNSTYIHELFSFPLEQEAIIETTVTASDNKEYGTKGGNDTKDKLFLLSDDEFMKYEYLLPETHNLWWLRTPGSTLSSTSFISTDKTIMNAGYDNGSDAVKVRPVIWVDVTP